MAIEDGIAVLDSIADKIADYCDEHNKPPTKIKLPARSACQLMKARGHLGEKLLNGIRKRGIRAFEKCGIDGLAVELVYEKNAELIVE